MPVISVTRLRLRSLWYLPRFFRHAIPASRQARRAEGNLGLELLRDAHLAFWTKSAWKDEAALHAYVRSGAHSKAMPTLMDMCDEGATLHWTQDSATLPSWQEAHRRLVESGRASRVRNPSPAHQSRQFPPTPPVAPAFPAEFLANSIHIQY